MYFLIMKKNMNEFVFLCKSVHANEQVAIVFELYHIVKLFKYANIEKLFPLTKINHP